MKILVVGDKIVDHYVFCKATRLCPEAPAPVLVIEKIDQRNGGANLVFDQLCQLVMDDGYVDGVYGSTSVKQRFFADRTLICRVDQDSMQVNKFAFPEFKDYDAVIVSDYGKGSMDEQLARGFVNRCKENNVPLFVDTKMGAKFYIGSFALFPNEHEHVFLSEDFCMQTNVIRKLGKRGCAVNMLTILPEEEQQVYDVTGAGDVFLAAFVYKWLKEKQNEKICSPNTDWLIQAAKFANKVAGISVRHLGTHVVTWGEINEVKK